MFFMVHVLTYVQDVKRRSKKAKKDGDVQNAGIIQRIIAKKHKKQNVNTIFEALPKLNEEPEEPEESEEEESDE